MVRWIGWDVDLSRKNHTVENKVRKIIDVEALENVPIDEKTLNFSYKGNRMKIERYGLTKDG